MIEKRPLGFFPGQATGALIPYDYESDKGATIMRLSSGNQEGEAYYNGGCFFEEADCDTELRPRPCLYPGSCSCRP